MGQSSGAVHRTTSDVNFDGKLTNRGIRHQTCWEYVSNDGAGAGSTGCRTVIVATADEDSTASISNANKMKRTYVYMFRLQ